MKWVVSGGTGFIGTALVRSLEGAGHEVVVLSRRAGRSEGRTRQVAWTAGEAGPWMSELDGADVVVHLAGAGVMDERWSAERLEEIRRTRVEPGRLIAEAIAGASHRPRVLVSGSAVGIYGMRMDDTELAEETAAGSDVLAKICVEWEQCADSARAAGVRVVHPRTGIVLGTEGGALAKMLPAFKAFVGGPLGSGRQWVPWVHRDDVVGAITFAADSDRIVGPFNVTAPSPVRMRELAEVIGRVLRRPSLMPVPAAALRLLLGGGAEALLTGQRAIPAKLLEAGYAFRFPALEDALRDLLQR